MNKTMRALTKTGRRAAILLPAAILYAAGAAGCARAATYDFTAGPGITGFVTTGTASSRDPGYDLLTAIDFTLISGTTQPPNATPFSYQDEVATMFTAGAAFNPGNGAFVNHFNGNTYLDSGLLSTNDLNINGISSGRFIRGTIFASNPFFTSTGVLTFSNLSISPVTRVREPAMLGVLALAAGLVAAARSRRLG